MSTMHVFAHPDGESWNDIRESIGIANDLQGGFKFVLKGLTSPLSAKRTLVTTPKMEADDMMTPQPTDPGAVLGIRTVGKIDGRFHVPRYQRGYRWGPTEVKRLLDDIHGSVDAYSLQPVVVLRRKDGSWELVDGQQRLTTIFLLFTYFRRSGLWPGARPPYTMDYETREKSAEFLSDPRDWGPPEYRLFPHASCVSMHRALVREVRRERPAVGCAGGLLGSDEARAGDLVRGAGERRADGTVHAAERGPHPPH